MAIRQRTGDLERVLADSWALLAQALRDPRSALRTPVLATVGLRGEPNARTLALWHIDPPQRRLYFNTDSRSTKFTELNRTPRAMFVFYDPATETQLRIRAEVCLHRDDAIAHEGWAELSPEDRRFFLTERPPGTPAAMPTAGVSADLAGSPDAALRAGHANFVVIEATATSLDWLHISPTGHRRAAFEWDGAGNVHATWLYP